MNFTEFYKMFTEFYFETQYFNSDWKITITLLHSLITKISTVAKNSADVIHDVTATVGKTPPWGCAKSENLSALKRYSTYIAIAMWYWILLNFKRYWIFNLWSSVYS